LRTDFGNFPKHIEYEKNAAEEEEEERQRRIQNGRAKSRGPRNGRGNPERASIIHENLSVRSEQQNCVVRVAVHRRGYSNEEKSAVQIGGERYREESKREKIETHGGISRAIRAD